MEGHFHLHQLPDLIATAKVALLLRVLDLLRTLVRYHLLPPLYNLLRGVTTRSFLILRILKMCLMFYNCVFVNNVV